MSRANAVTYLWSVQSGETFLMTCPFPWRGSVGRPSAIQYSSSGVREQRVASGPPLVSTLSPDQHHWRAKDTLLISWHIVSMYNDLLFNYMNLLIFRRLLHTSTTQNVLSKIIKDCWSATTLESCICQRCTLIVLLKLFNHNLDYKSWTSC